MINEQLIAFKRGKLLVKNTDVILSKNIDDRARLLYSFIQELGNCGYYLSPEIIAKISEDEIKEAYKTVIPYLSEKYHLMHGKDFAPLYPGFPEQVISKSELELIFDRDLVYSGNYDEFVKQNPWYSESDKEKIKNHTEKEIKLMTQNEFDKILVRIVSSNNSLMEETKDELIWLLSNYPKINLPEKIPFKETLCIVMDYRPDYKARSINDVLRYGIYKLGLDPGLIKDSESRKSFNPFPRSVRRSIILKIDSLIKEQGEEKLISEARLFYSYWLLLSEKLHWGEYNKLSPKTMMFFMRLKFTKDCKTWNSKVQELYNKKEPITKIAKFISKHPGEFIRKFDSLLRRAVKENLESDIMDIFIETEGMSNKTLIELINYYDKRLENVPRVINVKGSRKPIILDPLPPMSSEMIDTIQDVIKRKIFKNISVRVKEKDLLGKTVYIDPEIEYIAIPKSMRSQTICIPRGSKIPFPENKNIIRFFVHWIQDSVNEDLDLHAYFVDNDCTCSENIGWNSRLKSNYGVHSGDVLNRPGKCAEYVDIDISAAVAHGFRYVIMDVYNYKDRGFDTLPCWLGYNFRDALLEGDKNWSPNNVELMSPITTTNSKCAAMLADLVERNVMILDIDLSGLPVNINGDTCQQDLVKFFTTPSNFSVFELLHHHYISRGAEIVTNLSELPEDEITEKVTKAELINDYTKILAIIGE